MFKYLLTAALLLLTTSLAQATIYFDDSFEYPTQAALEASPWATSCPGNPSGVMTPEHTIVHSGSTSLHEHLDDIDFCSLDRSHPVTADVYMRFYYYAAPNFVYSSVVPTKLMFNYVQAPNGAMLTLFGTGTNQIGDFSNITNGADAPTCPTFNPVGSNGCFYPPNQASAALNAGQWYCIETHSFLGSPNTTNGLIEQWVNGVLTLRYTNILLNGGGGTTGYYNAKTYAQHGTGDRYIDDWAVGNTRIGCGVGPPPPSITTTTLPNASLNVPYSQTLTESGGVSPFTWSVITNVLPPGLSLNSATGIISGIPTTAGSYSFTIQLKDANNTTASQPLNILVTSILPTVTGFNTNPTGVTGLTGTQDINNLAAYIRMQYGSNTDPNIQFNNIFPISRYPGWPNSGTFQFTPAEGTTWPAGTQFACLHAQDSGHNESATDFVCKGVALTTPLPSPPTILRVR